MTGQLLLSLECLLQLLDRTTDELGCVWKEELVWLTSVVGWLLDVILESGLNENWSLLTILAYNSLTCFCENRASSWQVKSCLVNSISSCFKSEIICSSYSIFMICSLSQVLVKLFNLHCKLAISVYKFDILFWFV